MSMFDKTYEKTPQGWIIWEEEFNGNMKKTRPSTVPRRVVDCAEFHNVVRVKDDGFGTVEPIESEACDEQEIEDEESLSYAKPMSEAEATGTLIGLGIALVGAVVVGIVTICKK